MGLDLSSFEKFKQEVTSSSSTSSSSNSYSTSVYGNNENNSYASVSLFSNENKEEEKTVENAYDEFFEEMIFGSEEEVEETSSSKEEKATSKKENANDKNNGTVKDYEANEVGGGDFENTTDAINALLDSELFQNVGIKDGASHIKDDVINNTEWKVDMDVDGDGVIDQGVSLADAIAASFDSELDLYIEQQVQAVMAKYECYDIKALFGSENSQAVKDLAALGIRADAVGDDEHWQNRTYSFSLVEVPENFDELSPEEQMAIVYSDDAKILEDANGKKGSMIFADCLVPDGMAQGAELNLSSILDTMGYDCISKADFIGKEDEYYALMNEIGEDINNGVYTSDGTTHADIYSENTLKIWIATRARDTANGDAPGQWSQHLTFQDTLDRIERFGLGAEGGSLRKTGALSTNNAKLTGDIDSINGEKTAIEEMKAEKEAENKEKSILKELISEYEAKHNEKPVGQDLAKLEHEASLKAKTQA